MEIKVRDLVSGIPRTLTITAEEVRMAIQEHVDTIVATVRDALEQTPPQLAADIVDQGIMLTGGGALLKGLDKLLREKTEVPVFVAEDPLTTVVLGAGQALENIEILKEVAVS
jgi:rod shape-determining protein MreB